MPIMPNSHPLLSRMEAKAQEDSKGGYVQHVNADEKGNVRTSDWYDSDTTVSSYEGGREIHRNENHPLLRKPEWRRRAEEGSLRAKDTTNG